MPRNSDEKLLVAEAEASEKGTESLDDPENNGRTDTPGGVLYFTKLKGRQCHNTKATFQCKKVAGPIPPTEEDAFLSFLTSLSMTYIVPLATSSAFYLLLPHSHPSGKFLLFPALSRILLLTLGGCTEHEAGSWGTQDSHLTALRP